MRYFDDIWEEYISGLKGVPLVRMVTLPCFLLQLSPLNELESGNLDYYIYDYFYTLLKYFEIL